ncbi:hypothetical protein ACHAXR_009177 [Thalassiosira sp. AJA248-18]
MATKRWKSLFRVLLVTAVATPIFSGAMSISSTSAQMIESRLRSALWGMFSGDALASPTHWYYGGFPQIQSDYGRAGITGYTRPVTNLPGSILNKSDPNGGGRRSFSLKFGNKSDENLTIIGDVINHGKLKYWDPKKSIHYHATLQQGENTLEMQIARVLMKSIVANNGRFDEDHFRKAFVDFMTTEGSHNDTYASTCHRMFFANMIFHKKDPKDCPDNDGHNVDAIDGLILPSITALAETARQLSLSGNTSLDMSEESKGAIQKASARTAAVTRSSDMLGTVSEVWANLVSAALITPIREGGVGNEMEQPLREVAQRLGLGNPQSNKKDQMSACYLSQSLPPTLDMLCKYTKQIDGDGLWKALIANANIGGENVHRGAVLGAILGARVGDEQVPKVLKSGLHDRELLEEEIDLFVNAVMQKNGDKKTTSKEL